MHGGLLLEFQNDLKMHFFGPILETFLVRRNWNFNFDPFCIAVIVIILYTSVGMKKHFQHLKCPHDLCAQLPRLCVFLFFLSFSTGRHIIYKLSSQLEVSLWKVYWVLCSSEVIIQVAPWYSESSAHIFWVYLSISLRTIMVLARMSKLRRKHFPFYCVDLI